MTLEITHDMVGQEIRKGDLVVHYNYLFVVEEITRKLSLPEHSNIRIMLYEPSKTSRPKTVPSYQVVRVDKYQVENWFARF